MKFSGVTYCFNGYFSGLPEMGNIMQKFKPLFILAFSLLIIYTFSSCEKVSNPISATREADGNTDYSDAVNLFQIHLRYSYDSTYTDIAIDDKTVFTGYVTTNNIVGLAEIITPEITKGTHTLYTHIGGLTKDTTFSVQDSLIISVIYSEQGDGISVYFLYPPNFPVYE